MRRWLGLVLISLSCWLPTSAAQPEPRPKWCMPGWECVRRSEMVADAEFHLDLKEQVLKYKARGSRLGFTIGPGFGVAGVIDENFTVHYVPAPGVYLVWGLRF